jgi:hypothetical protein
MVEMLIQQPTPILHVPPLRSTTVIVPSAVALALVIFLFLPLVPYAVSFSAPNNYNAKELQACGNPSNSSSYSSCAAAAAYPPSTVHGSASLSYYTLGLGNGPFPEDMLATQGNRTFLLHFVGTTLVYLESFFRDGYAFGTTLNPSGAVKVDNVSISQWAFGMVNFSARLTNTGTKSLLDVLVGFQYPTYGSNGSIGGYRFYQPPFTNCATILSPGAGCTASKLLNESSSLLTDQYYPLTLEVWSQNTTPGPSAPFLFLQTASVRYPGVGLNSHWVQAFIQEMNHLRNGTALTEDKALDAFAAFRYDTIRAQYQISDYNFSVDYNRYFGASAPTVFEEILYPAGRDPVTYPNYLHQTAIGHYSAIVNPFYTKYGYFFGTGPAVEVGPGCSATEVPGPNINITQYAISHGCSYVIADEIWFILILGA